MESISISRLDLILKQFIRIDQYKWYSRLLKEYATEAFTVNGMPAPIYVAKRMAYSQENDNFGMVEMKDFLVPLCNTAFLLHCQAPEIAVMNEKIPNFDVTFDSSICQDIIKMEKEVSRKIRSHIICLEGLRDLQKDCWYWEKRLKHRNNRLDNFLKKNIDEGQAVSSNLKTKYDSLVLKQSEAAKRYRAILVCFQEKIEDEKKLRTVILQKVAAIREKLSSAMKESLLHAYSDMIQAVYMAKEQDGFNLVDQQLAAVNIDGIVEKIYEITSSTYNTPLPEDYIQATGSDEKLAEIYYKECDFEVLGMNNGNYFRKLKTEKKSLFEKTESGKEGCFFPINGRIRTNPVTRDEKSRGIINIKTGYQVKLKLSLMNRKIGFGWVRQNAFFRGKTWGFYFLTSEDSTTTSTIDVPSVSSLKANPTIEVTDCSEDYRGQGDNRCVVAQENHKHENTEKKEQEDAIVVPIIKKLIAECIHDIFLEENILGI
ncbi:Hypothetical predicted protein [Mytilus galloprovincialis]|uniref:Uncharacterized protein n=1 Tax=Mytilus galloprovincialis TaxID=29158 RepID=A0A8B6BGK5_MYTGA|nr:Hypothetical predicted protein [Mytilus galloprovincialis]